MRLQVLGGLQTGKASVVTKEKFWEAWMAGKRKSRDVLAVVALMGRYGSQTCSCPLNANESHRPQVTYKAPCLGVSAYLGT